MGGIIDVFRSGAWLTRERMRMVAFALLATSLIGVGYLIATSDGLNDRLGRPLGIDFSNVYAAGTYVLDGQPTAPFDPARQFAREQAIFGTTATPFYDWYYRPFFLGLAALLALMPYGLALALWQGVMLVHYLLSIRAIVAASSPSPLRGTSRRCSSISVKPTMASSPPHSSAPRFANSTAGRGLAGVLIGCPAYKPQFGLLIPLVLMVSGRWRVFAAAAVTVALLALAITLAFGAEVWTAFLVSTRFTRMVVLEQGGTGWFKIQRVFSLVRMWGGGIALAYALQGAVTLLVAATLGWLWHTAAAFPLKAAALVIGCLLATPYTRL